MTEDKTAQVVAFEWKPGDVILDLYEVRTVTEGFGDNAREKDYHEGGVGRVYKVWHRTWRREMAVKSPRAGVFTTQKQKDAFTRECETWVNLGLHAHIAACHYVRDLGGVPRVFSEYAVAGTLEDWIRSKRLYEGDKQTALARMLDAAIQFAWGLHYAHERGVIHQDVKPLNALMWDDGTLKVTDFGLAGARQKAGITVQSADPVGGKHSIMVSTGGMTPSHCSPEQATGRQLDRRTDVWSWAVSVLEMFVGEVTWQSGSAAAEALEAYIEESASANQQSEIPAMPADVAALLRRCFQKNPADRPRTLHECATTLYEVYHSETGKPYSRTEPKDIGDTADALNNRALSMLDLGKPDEAERLFDRALELDKHHVAATYNHGMILWRERKSTDNDVLASLKEIKKEHPNEANLELALGWVRMENADYTQALSNFEKAIEFGNNSDARTGQEKSQPLAESIRGYPRLFDGHTDSIHSAAYSSDGRFIISGGNDLTLRLWDVATGQCRRIFEGHTGIIFSVAYSPDGCFVLSGSLDDKTLRLWDVATGKCLRTFEGHTDYVNSVAFSPDGRFVLSGGGCTLRLWDVTAGQCLRTFKGHMSGIKCVAYSPDGRFVLSGGNELRLWEVATGECLRIFTGHTDTVDSVAYSPDGRLIISGSGRALLLWDVSTSQRLHVFKGHTDVISSVAYSPDGRLVISGSGDHTLRLWDVAAGQCLRTFDGNMGWVQSVSFSPDGYVVLSGSNDKTLRLWEVSSVKKQRIKSPWFYSMVVTAEDALERQHLHEIHLSHVREVLNSGRIAEALTFLRQARAVPRFEKSRESLELQARVGARCRIKSYGGGWLKRTFEGYTNAVFSPAGHLAIVRKEKMLRLLDIATGRCLRTFEGHTDYVNSVAYSHDGCFVISGSKDKTLRLWDVATGKCLRTFKGNASSVGSVAYSPDDCFVLSGGWDEPLRLWDASTGQCLRTFEGHTGCVSYSVVYSPDGFFAFSGGWDEPLRLLDVATGQCLRTFEGYPEVVNDVAYSPDGHFVLSGNDDSTLRLWDVTTGKCLRTFEGHTGPVDSVVYSPDSHFLLSGSYDKTLRLWDMATGQCLRTFEGHTGSVGSVAFSPDGRFALSGSSDNTLRLWELDWEYEYDPEYDPVLKHQAQGKPGAEPIDSTL